MFEQAAGCCTNVCLSFLDHCAEKEQFETKESANVLYLIRFNDPRKKISCQWTWLNAQAREICLTV